MNKYIVILVSFLFSPYLKGQDYHLSQYDAQPLYLNPALTGVFNNSEIDYRIGLNFRTQWKALLPKPYSTFSAYYDQKINEKFSAGGYVINNRAVSGAYNTFTLMASGSYNVIEKDQDHFLTTGLQIGLINMATTGQDFTYDQQYDANSESGFNTQLDNGEYYSKQSIFRFDANFGIYYKYQASGSKIKPFVGISSFHLAMPKESFTGANNKLPIRWVANTGAEYQLNEQWTLIPNILYMSQAKANDFNIGVSAHYKFNEKSEANYKGIFGINYRNKDALIFHLGIIKDDQILRFSYDYNTSFLKNYSNGRGAFEVSLILTGKKGEPFLKSFSSF